MTPEKYIEKVKKLYDKYWEGEEIDIDVANELVESIPKLIKMVETLINR